MHLVYILSDNLVTCRTKKQKYSSSCTPQHGAMKKNILTTSRSNIQLESLKKVAMEMNYLTV